MPLRTFDGRLACANGEVHIWRVCLHTFAGEFDRVEAVLSADERERARQFRTPWLRRRWMSTRAALRAILSVYVGIRPEALVFATDANHKPLLAMAGAEPLFNVTYAGQLAFVAVSANAAVGIDAEVVQPDFECEEIAQRFFTCSEADAICSAAPQRRVEAFFACWTRKEAYLKALGTGLLTPLHSFQVTVGADEPARLLWTADDADAARLWCLKDLSEPGIAVALATKRLDRIRRFDFPAAELLACRQGSTADFLRDEQYDSGQAWLSP